MLKFLLKLIYLLLPVVIIFFYYNYYRTSGDVWSAQCDFHRITSLYCPGCGGQRAFDSLLHGEWLIAFKSNMLIFLFLPFFTYAYFLLGLFFVFEKKELFARMPFPPKLGYVFLIVIILFFAIRNLSIFPFKP